MKPETKTELKILAKIAIPLIIFMGLILVLLKAAG